MQVMGDTTMDGAGPREVGDVDPLDLSVPVKTNGRSNGKDFKYGILPVDDYAGFKHTEDEVCALPQYCPTSSPLNADKTFHSAPAVSKSALPEDKYGNKDSTNISGNSFERNARPFKAYPNVDLKHTSLFGIRGSKAIITSVLPSPYEDEPSALALPSSYSASLPGSSLLTDTLSLGVSPTLSHFVQKRRRHETRDNTEREQSASTSTSASATVTTAMEEDNSSDPDNKKQQSETGERKDDAYWERRRKNNEAAKRSRDARRQKEEEIAMRAAFLEQENLKLRAQVAILKNETAKLHYLLYNRV